MFHLDVFYFMILRYKALQRQAATLIPLQPAKHSVRGKERFVYTIKFPGALLILRVYFFETHVLINVKR